MPLSDRLEQACRTHKNRIAFYQADGTPVLFSSLFFTIIAFAEQLAGHGVKPGDRVANRVADTFATSLLHLAVLRLGATSLGLPPRRADAPDPVPLDYRILAPGEAPRDPGDIAFDPGWIRSPTRPVPIAAGGVLVISTSGTTGEPKQRAFTEDALLASIEHSLAHRATSGAVLLAYGPTGPALFKNFLAAALKGQSQMHALSSERETLEMMDRIGVGAARIAPYNFERLVSTAEATGIIPDTLRRVMSGGGPVSPELARRGETVFGCEVYNTYGSTETGSIAHCRPALATSHSGTVGQVYSEIEIRFRDHDGRPATARQGGELLLQPPPAVVPVDYPSGRSVADADGWVSTGDIGRILPDGNLQLTGRVSDLINTGGNKHAPGHFEVMVRDFPHLTEAVAFRLPAAGGGDAIGLAVTGAPGFDPAALHRALAARLGPIYPIRVIPVDRLPYTDAGKIDRKRLTLTYSEKETAVA